MKRIVSLLVVLLLAVMTVGCSSGSSSGSKRSSKDSSDKNTSSTAKDDSSKEDPSKDDPSKDDPAKGLKDLLKITDSPAKDDTASKDDTSSKDDSSSKGGSSSVTAAPAASDDKVMAQKCRRTYTNNSPYSNPYLVIEFDFGNGYADWQFHESDIYTGGKFDTASMDFPDGYYFVQYYAEQVNVEYCYIDYTPELIKIWYSYDGEDPLENESPSTYYFVDEYWTEYEVTPTPVWTDIDTDSTVRIYELVSQNGLKRSEVTDTSDKRAASFVNGTAKLEIEIYSFMLNITWLNLGPHVMSPVDFTSGTNEIRNREDVRCIADIFDYDGYDAWEAELEFSGNELTVNYTDDWIEGYRIVE